MPSKEEVGTVSENGVGTPTVPIGTHTWSESHFRALLKHLTYDAEADNADAVRDAQLKCLEDIYKRASDPERRVSSDDKKVTAKWIGTIAAKYAWYIRLEQHLAQRLNERVSEEDYKAMVANIRNGVYGGKEDETDFEKFDKACTTLNEQVLGVTLYHDDAFRRLPQLEDDSVALVITDPPYNTTAHEWDRIGTDEEFLDFTRRWLEAVRPKLAQDYQLFFFCDADYQAGIENILTDNGWPIQSRIIWWNRSLPSGRNVSGRFVRTWQMLFHIGNHDLNWSEEWSEARFDVQVYAAPNANTSDGGYHPTPKPEALIQYLVELGSKPTDIVLDLFAGGGATGAACVAAGQRQCILIEKESQFCEAIEKRLDIKRI